jgi:hypothetical protein
MFGILNNKVPIKDYNNQKYEDMELHDIISLLPFLTISPTQIKNIINKEK